VFHADGPKEGYIRPANYYCRDFRLAPPFPLIVRKGTERGFAVLSVRTSRGFAVLDLLLATSFRFGSHDFVSSSLFVAVPD
jgi:hypothetical protein